MVFEDDFSGTSLDSDNWGVGFGWGTRTNSPEVITADHVNVEDSMLKLTADHEGTEINAGAINSKNRFYTGPGSYWEARIKAPKRVGYLPAFWSKPNSEDWPPEIDFFELFSTDDRSDVWSTANYNVHYSRSTDPGDNSTHDAQPVHYNTGVDLTRDFHIYGCRWLSDRVDFYFDGNHVGSVTDETTMEALRRGAPFYMMCNIHIDRTGTTDKSEPWTEPDDTMFVDWVRVWELDGSSDGSTTEEPTEEPTDEGDHYVWFRSADGGEATFEFGASGGNIHYDTSGQEADYQIADDRESASGTVARTSNLPGFWYDGEIDQFSYSGPLDVFIDNEAVDPDSLVTESTEEPTEEPTDGDHYLWVRSGDGSAAEFVFETSGGNVHYDSSGQEADYWIGDDAMLGGGTVARTSSLPGFWYDGEIIDFSYEGSLDVFIDNEAVDPDTLVDPNRPGPYAPGELPNTITIDGSVSSGSADYSLTVSDAIAPAKAMNAEDSIEGATATGAVGGGSDAYRYSGSIKEFVLDGDAGVVVDGSELSRITIERAPESKGNVRYLIETSGTLIHGEPSSAEPDEVEGGKAYGRVKGDADEYWLRDGSLVDVSTFRGEVVVTVDGTVVDASD
ncbi:glycoside hydrolase family 16 protein [Halobaculum marinum]|uniref:Glycoside hydrolase family 16 protein n=1 Tax=Halobaculum marinum TaxID=3031996 RepID=A0ABD5WRF2_9EURY|nr:glycoside hydrolase family 16 protein [Halobaculum sp. DT55]